MKTAIIKATGLTMTALLTGDSSAATRKRPNILFIMSDDHTTLAIGVDGDQGYRLGEHDLRAERSGT